ncbi:hypothetical protein B0H11DRAFT_1931248 [Mycena galericulata]|nr:hypothetical protein B0H11DRAFT_1931248 [Mycena galericulata]
MKPGAQTPTSCSRTCLRVPRATLEHVQEDQDIGATDHGISVDYPLAYEFWDRPFNTIPCIAEAAVTPFPSQVSSYLLFLTFPPHAYPPPLVQKDVPATIIDADVELAPTAPHHPRNPAREVVKTMLGSDIPVAHMSGLASDNAYSFLALLDPSFLLCFSSSSSPSPFLSILNNNTFVNFLNGTTMRLIRLYPDDSIDFPSVEYSNIPYGGVAIAGHGLRKTMLSSGLGRASRCARLCAPEQPLAQTRRASQSPGVGAFSIATPRISVFNLPRLPERIILRYYIALRRILNVVAAPSDLCLQGGISYLFDLTQYTIYAFNVSGASSARGNARSTRPVEEHKMTRYRIQEAVFTLPRVITIQGPIISARIIIIYLENNTRSTISEHVWLERRCSLGSRILKMSSRHTPSGFGRYMCDLSTSTIFSTIFSTGTSTLFFTILSTIFSTGTSTILFTGTSTRFSTIFSTGISTTRSTTTSRTSGAAIRPPRPPRPIRTAPSPPSSRRARTTGAGETDECRNGDDIDGVRERWSPNVNAGSIPFPSNAEQLLSFELTLTRDLDFAAPRYSLGTLRLGSKPTPCTVDAFRRVQRRTYISRNSIKPSINFEFQSQRFMHPTPKTTPLLEALKAEKSAQRAAKLHGRTVTKRGRSPPAPTPMPTVLEVATAKKAAEVFPRHRTNNSYSTIVAEQCVSAALVGGSDPGTAQEASPSSLRRCFAERDARPLESCSADADADIYANTVQDNFTYIFVYLVSSLQTPMQACSTFDLRALGLSLDLFIYVFLLAFPSRLKPSGSDRIFGLRTLPQYSSAARSRASATRRRRVEVLDPTLGAGYDLRAPQMARRSNGNQQSP